MPAVATFMRTYVSELSFIKTLRSKIRRTSGEDSSQDSKPSFPKPGRASYGPPNVQVPGNYEPTDPAYTITYASPNFQGPGNYELTNPAFTAPPASPNFQGPPDYELMDPTYIATYGSPNFQRPGSYEPTDPAYTTTYRSSTIQVLGNHELADSSPTPSHVVPDEHYLSSRHHSTEHQQPYTQPNSTDRLV